MSVPRPFFNSFKNLGRKWLKRSRPDYVRSKPKFEFTVASYNVLADHLLHDHPYLYYNNNNTRDSWMFDWNYRKKNLISEITYANADILCLQEVQEEHYYDWFHPQLQKHGYTGIYKKRSGDKVDGCATFFKHDLFTVNSVELVDFHRPNNTFMDRNNVAIIAILNPKADGINNPSPICVGNTHLLFNKKRGDIKLAQLTHLFAEIDRCTTNLVNMSNANTRVPVIICGDFNSSPYSPLYDFVRKGLLKFEGLKMSRVSGQGDHNLNANYSGRVFEKNAFPSSLGLTHTCKWKTLSNSNFSAPDSVMGLTSEKTCTDRTTSNGPSRLIEQLGVLSHDLQLRSCYMHQDEEGRHEITTFHDKAALTVDYIFYSPNCWKTPTDSSQETVKDRLWLGGVLGLLTQNDLRKFGKLPNREISSDHLMLMANFILTE